MANTDLEAIKAIADQLPLGIWVATAPRGELVYANKAFQEILGMNAKPDVAAGQYTAAYSILRRGGGPYPEAELPFARALMERAMVMVDDIVVRRPDGTEVDVRAFAQPMFGSNGEVAQVSVSFIDITKEVQARTAKRKSEEIIRTVVNAAPVILFSFDKRGTITLSEGRGLKRMGLTPGQLVGQNVFELVKGNPQSMDNSRRAAAGAAFSTIGVFQGATLETTYAPILDEHGAAAGTVGVSVDITEQQKMQQQLLAADRMAAVGTLAAGVAHEINNPLTFVMASLELAERQLGNPEQAKTHLGAAREGAARVARIARDLFTFSRDAGTRPTPMRLRTAVEAAVRIASSQTAGVARVIEEHSNAPLVLADEGRVAQVLLNLLINAAHAIDASGRATGEIRIRTGTDEKGHAFVEVSDDGAGIDAELVPHVFDPFVTTKPAGMGTGLGLSVSKAIVEGFGGDLIVSSTKGKGSTFRMRLPPAPPGQSESASAPMTAPAIARAKVLLIDDDANLCRAFRAVLEPEHEVKVCMRGEDAVKTLLSDETFDVVLCDVMLNDVQARSIYEQVKAGKPGREQELVFITGGAYMRDAREFLASVPNLRYEKPFQIDQVLADVLRRRRPR
jgi:two-component system, cell cycle sensor histidine kinase and response regulator CckA